MAIAEPPALQARPHVGRFPVPYITAIPGGKPDFRVHDLEARDLCAKRSLCQLCGLRLSRDRAGKHEVAGATVFVGNEVSVDRGIFGEPPMHSECMEFAWSICPWLLGADGRTTMAAGVMSITPRATEPERMGIVYAEDWSVIPDDEVQVSGVQTWKWQIRSTNDIWRVEFRMRG